MRRESELIFLPWSIFGVLAGKVKEPQIQGAAKPIPGLPKEAKYDVQGELTAIGQYLPPFPSRYWGPNSLPSGGQAAATETATVYLGARALPNLEFYANPEIAWGNAPGGGVGLAGYLNGDLIGQPTSSAAPYLARAFARWRIPIRQGKDQPVGKENVGRAPNIIAGPVPQHRLIVTVGKVAVTDIFDANAYANNPRTQFLNDAFVNDLAYDAAQDARGYDFGASIVLVNPSYSIRVGSFAMPTLPGGSQLRYDLGQSHSEQLEVDLNPQILRASKPPLTIRFLGYRNVGNMASYSAANGARLDGPPDLGAVRNQGTVRAGLGLNLEQGLADGGNTGIFARLGCADGSVEPSGFAEADDAWSLGVQLSGARWNRKADILGLAAGQSGISAIHQRYLGLGGQGFSLGDGGLRYGRESVCELYYLYQTTKSLQITGDIQIFNNPGFNRDRGPASALSLRARVAF